MYLKRLPENISLPEMVRVRQRFDNPTVDDIRNRISEEFKKTNINKKIKPGTHC